MTVTRSDILKVIKDTQIRVDIEELDFEMPLADQGLDSLDLTVILFALEESYQTKIPEEDIEKLNSLTAILEYLNDKLR